MKKILLFVLMFVNLGSALAKDLVVGCYNKPPYCYKNSSGQIVGIFPDIMREVAKEMGNKVSFQMGNRDFVLKQALIGAYDAFIPLIITEYIDRKYFKTCSISQEPIINVSLVFFALDSDKEVGVMEIYKGLVGLKRNFYYSDLTKSTLEPFSCVFGGSDEENFRALRNKQLIVVVADEWEGKFLAKKMGLKVKVVMGPLDFKGLNIMFNNTTVDKQFIDEYNASYGVVKQGYMYEEILNKYMN